MFENRYVKALQPYAVVTHKAWENKECGEILKLDWNEATILPSPAVIERLNKMLISGRLNWYPDLRNENLLALLGRYTSLPENNIQYFSSSDALHEYIVRAFIEPEDRILILGPTYDNFRAVVESNGAVTELFILDERFSLAADEFEQKIKLTCPKIVYICNPNNPTGTLHSTAYLEQLINLFPQTLFIIDEAYNEFSGVSCKDLVTKYENIVISRTFSKAFALASFRIGYALSSANNIRILSKVRNPKSVSAFAQEAAEAALEDFKYTQDYVDEVNLSKSVFDKAIKNMGINVSGDSGNFSLLKVGLDQKRAIIERLESAKIFVRDYGHVQGLEDYIRITIGTRPQMKRVIDVLSQIVNG